MDVKQLYYFITVVDAGNISQAAKKLHMSQPPLSNQLHLLEEELGTQLLIRGSRSVTLTDAGKILYQRAESILSLVDITKTEVLAANSTIKGTLRIGCVSSVAGTKLAAWLCDYHSLFPDVTLDVYEANTYELLEKLKANIIELAIVRTPFLADSFDCIALDKEPMIAVYSTKAFAMNDKSIKLKALNGKPLLIYRRWENILNNEFSKHKLTPNVISRNDDAKTTVLWAQAGLGIGIVPLSAMHFIEDSSCTYSIIDESELDSTISIIHNKKGYMSSIAKRFLEQVISKPKI